MTRRKTYFSKYKVVRSLDSEESYENYSPSSVWSVSVSCFSLFIYFFVCYGRVLIKTANDDDKNSYLSASSIRRGKLLVGVASTSAVETFLAELAEHSPITLRNSSSNPSSRKNLVVRPYDRTRCYF